MPVEGAPTLRLGDVANVVEDHQPLIGDAITSGPGLILVVEKSPSANTLQVTRGLEKAIADMRPGLTGVEINSSIYRPASFIEMAMGNLANALLLSGLLVALVLGAFLFEWRAGLVSAIAIPASLTAGALVLYFRGASVNTMVVAGFLVALGLVIDDAILDVEQMVHRLRQRTESSPQSAVAVIVQTAIEVRGAALYATLILALVIAPVWLIGGLSGALLQPMAISYAMAMLASMVVALTLTPALSFFLLGRAPIAAREPPLVSWLQTAYGRALAPILRAPHLAFVLLAAVAVLGAAMIPLVRQSLVPSFKELDLLIQLDGPPGTSRSEMNRIVTRLGDELRTIPGVRNVGANVGRAVLSDRLVDVNASEVWVNLDPSAQYEPMVATVREVVDGYPGLRHTIRTYLDERSSALSEDSGTLTVRVFGENQAVLRQVANDVQRALTGIDGLAGQRLDVPARQPTVQVTVDLAAAQTAGLAPGDVRRAAATLLSGLQAGSLFENQKVFDVVVWGMPESRHSVSSIRDLLLDTPAGGHVRLGDVAQVHIAPSLSVVRHQDVRSYLDIRADVRGRAMGEVAGDMERRLQGMHLPLEYHAEVLGGYATQEAAAGRLLGASIAALLGIFLILQAAFGSWRLAAVGLILLPAAVVGGLAALVAGGGILTLGGIGGLVAVLGIAARNSIMLVRHYQLIGRDATTVGPVMVLRGARERLGPTLMTAFATALAVVPLLLGGDAPGFEIARPLAVVVLGGLVTSTLLNVFVMPAAYLLLAGSAVPAPAAAVAPTTTPLPVGGAVSAAD